MEWKEYDFKSIHKQFFNLTSLSSLGLLTIVLGLLFPIIVIVIESKTPYVYQIAVFLILLGFLMKLSSTKKLRKYTEYCNDEMCLVRGKVLSRESSNNYARYVLSYRVDEEDFNYRLTVGRHSAQDRYLRNDLPVDLLVPKGNFAICFIREMVGAIERD